MRIVKEFVLREIAGDYILVPVGNTVSEFNGLITLNEVGVFLWERLQDDISQGDLVTAVLEEYEVDADTADRDVAEFLEPLKEAAIVR